MKTTKKKLADLRPAEYNPRFISEKDYGELKKSITKFGIVEPAVVNSYPGREGIIIGGHQRIRVAEDLGLDSFPCYIVSLPPDEERELNVRLNKNTGNFDFDILANEFEITDLTDWGFEETELLGLGVDPEELDPEEPDPEPDEVKTCPSCGYEF